MRSSVFEFVDDAETLKLKILAIFGLPNSQSFTAVNPSPMRILSSINAYHVVLNLRSTFTGHFVSEMKPFGSNISSRRLHWKILKECWKSTFMLPQSGRQMI